MSNYRIAGSIGAHAETSPDIQGQLDKARREALVIAGGIFDGERGCFHIVGKHPTLIGREATITLPLDALAMMMGPIMGNVVAPALKMFAQATAAAGEQAAVADTIKGKG